jgi:hypothetical protein
VSRLAIIVGLEMTELASSHFETIVEIIVDDTNLDVDDAERSPDRFEALEEGDDFQIRKMLSSSTISLTLSVQSQSPYLCASDKNINGKYFDENGEELKSSGPDSNPSTASSRSPIMVHRSNSDPSMNGSNSNIVMLSRCASEPLPLYYKAETTQLMMKKGPQRNSNRIRNNRRNVLVTLVRRVRPESLRTSFNNSVIKTFYCKICMENCAQSLSFSAHNCCRQHEYCIPCMTGYLTAQVDDGVIHFPCPGLRDCQGSLSSDELRLLLSDESISRLDRITNIKTNPLFRECPQCSAGHTAVSMNDTTTSDIICRGCKLTYCFYHANAHTGRTCQEYVKDMSKRVKDEINASEEYVGKITKGCPRCNAATEKNGGCNHM